MATLELKGVSRTFGTIEAMKRVSFDVADGEFFCLLGASSAGKTTTLRAIAGLEELSGGQVLFDGQEVNAAPVQGRGMSMIFQTFALYPHLSIRANLAYPLVRDKVAKKEIRRRVDEVAELLRVTHTLHRKPPTLSGGEQQRVAIGRAIVRRPQLLLLDEPLTNLDAKLRHDMRAEFKRLHRELGMTMLYATPDQLEALTMGQRIALLHDGEIVETGTAQSLYGEPSHTYVARMVGSPPINLIEGKISGSGPTRSLELPFGELLLEGRGADAPDGAITLGLRPQDLHLSERAPASTQGAGLTLPGKIHLTEPLGDVTILDIDIRGKLMKMVLPEDVAAVYSQGQVIDLSFRLADAHLFMTESGVRIS